MATSAINNKKQETEINATVTDIKEVKAFVNWRLLIYKEKGQKGFNLQESFINDFKSFTKDILNDFSKDQLKEIRDYLHKNGVYIRKEARKLITDSFLGVIHEPTPLKWPTDDSADKPTDDFAGNPTNDSAGNPTDDSANDPTDDSTNNLTDDSTLALLLLLTAPV